jgi:MFS family permease
MAALLAACAPLRSGAFRSLWIATMIANIGAWAQTVGAAWLLVEGGADQVALVQAASSAPVVLFSLVGGVLADRRDRVLVQLLAQSWSAVAALVLAGLVLHGVATPPAILVLTFLIGAGIAIRGPAWQAAICDLVPASQVPAAVVLSSVGFNLSRVVGPFVGGMVVATLGAAPAFLINVLTSLVLIAVLLRHLRWPHTRPGRVGGRATLRSGLRSILASPVLRAVLVRAVAVGIPASAVLALLPVLARSGLAGGALLYGLLLGAFGAGAVAGAVLLAGLRRRWPPETVLSGASLLFAAVLAGLSAAPSPAAAMALLGLAGIGWIAMLSTLNTTVQLSAQPELRGRALSAYMTCAFGGLAIGSVIWGELAAAGGLQASFLVAGATLAAGVGLRRHFALPVRDGSPA